MLVLRFFSSRIVWGGTYSHLAGDVDVGDVLVLAEEGQVEEDGERAGIGGQDDEF